MTEDELGTRRVTPASVFHSQTKVEGAIERWRSLDIERRTADIHGAGMDPDAVNLQVPKVRKLANEIEEFFVISPWKLQPQRFQGPLKRPEVYFHLRDE